jgi:allantoin racemase
MTKKRLRIVLPLAFDPEILDYCVQVFRGHLPHASLSVGFLTHSVESTVSDYDQFRNAPFVLKAVQAAIRDRCDGVFLDVAFDTALSAAKSLAPIPVVGALESAVAYARTLCRRFSIVAINAEEVAVDYRLSREYGFGDLLASVEPIDVPVMRLRSDQAHALRRMTEAAERALGKGAQALVLGCTAMGWAAQELAERLPIPVLDTSLVGLYMLDTLAELGLAPSRLEYRAPSGLVELDDEEYRALRRITFDVQSDTRVQ